MLRTWVAWDCTDSQEVRMSVMISILPKIREISTKKEGKCQYQVLAWIQEASVLQDHQHLYIFESRKYI